MTTQICAARIAGPNGAMQTQRGTDDERGVQQSREDTGLPRTTSACVIGGGGTTQARNRRHHAPHSDWGGQPCQYTEGAVTATRGADQFQAVDGGRGPAPARHDGGRQGPTPLRARALPLGSDGDSARGRVGTPFPAVNRNALWTGEFLAQAVAEWKDGASGHQIAVRLGRGLTRSAVIAKMHRLGLGNIPGRYKPRKAQPKQAKPPKPRVERVERAQRVRPSRSSGFALRPLGIKHPSALPARPLPLAQPTTDIARVRLDELKSRHCRWIVGDPKRIAAGQPVFCGSRREPGLPYCRDHNARAYHEVSAAPRQHYGEGGPLPKPRLQ